MDEAFVAEREPTASLGRFRAGLRDQSVDPGHEACRPREVLRPEYANAGLDELWAPLS